MREFFDTLWRLPEIIWTMPGEYFLTLLMALTVGCGFLGYVIWVGRR